MRYKNIPTKAKIGGQWYHFRSRWEYYYACYLHQLIIAGKLKAFHYEKAIFVFTTVKKGQPKGYYRKIKQVGSDVKVFFSRKEGSKRKTVCFAYLSDFIEVSNNDKVLFTEIKGKFDARSRQYIKNMRKYFPHVPFNVVAEEEMKRLGLIS